MRLPGSPQSLSSKCHATKIPTPPAWLESRREECIDQPANAEPALGVRRRPSPRRDWAGSTFIKMVGRAGIEPATLGLRGPCSAG
jgi:hypothetical protein